MKSKELFGDFLIIVVAVIISLLFTSYFSAKAEGTMINSEDVIYINSASGLSSEDVRGALDELYIRVGDYTDLQNDLNEIKVGLINKVYPVGSIYITTAYSNANQVHDALGGTWQAFGTDRVLRSSTGAAGQTGGATSATLSVANMPAHTHNFTAKGSVSSSFSGQAVTSTNQSANPSATFNGTQKNTNDASAAHSHTIYGFHVDGASSHFRFAIQGDGNLVVYNKNGAVWASGAKSGAGAVSDWHSVSVGSGSVQTTSSNASHAHSYTPAGTVSLSGNHTHNFTAKGSVSSTFTGSAVGSTSTGSGGAFSIIDPYITVFMYKRTA